MKDFLQKRRPRELNSSLSDVYTREEVLDILGRELAMPGKKMDVPLVEECLLVLNPDALEAPADGKASTWRRLQVSIREYQAQGHRVPRKRLALVLCVILLLALAAVGIALVLRGHSLTFVFDALGKRPPAITETAENLVQYDLAHAEFAHSIVDVREAVYDGHQLRIVYAVRNKDGAELTDEDKYPEPIIAAAQRDGLHGADYLYVDGQSFNILDVYEKPGDTPGEMLYYLSAKLGEQGYVPERTMMVGLPIAGDSAIIGAATTPPDMSRVEYVANERVPDGLLFPVRVDLGSDAMRLASVTDAQTQADMDIVVEEAEFSPLEVMLRVTLHGNAAQHDEDAFKNAAYNWAGARLYGPDGGQVGG